MKNLHVAQFYNQLIIFIHIKVIEILAMIATSEELDLVENKLTIACLFLKVNLRGRYLQSQRLVFEQLKR